MTRMIETMSVYGEITGNEMVMIENIIQRVIPEMIVSEVITTTIAPRNTNEEKVGNIVMVMTPEMKLVGEKERMYPLLATIVKMISTTVAAATIVAGNNTTVL